MKKLFIKWFGESSFVMRLPYITISILVFIILAGRIWPGIKVEAPSKISKYLMILEWVVIVIFVFFIGKWTYKQVKK